MAAARADKFDGSDTPTDAEPSGRPGRPAGAAPFGVGAPPTPGGAPGVAGRGQGEPGTQSGPTPARTPDGQFVTGQRPADSGAFAARAFADIPGDDTDTPTRGPGIDPLPHRVAGPPRPGGWTPRPGGPPPMGQFRTDQQSRPPEPYRPVGGTGGFPSALPPGSTHAPLPGRVPAPPPDPADELFAPRVPSRDADAELPGYDPHAGAFDMGETTPIFEEIASAWFRSNRPVPVTWQSDTGPQPAVPARPDTDDTDPNGIARSDAPTPSDGRAGSAGDGWSHDADRPVAGTPADGWPSVDRPTPEPDNLPTNGAADTRRRPRPYARPTPSAAQPSGPSSVPAAMPPGIPASRSTYDAVDTPPVRVPEPTPADFSTAADEGWLAASDAEAERPDELTAAGLPKRRPRARLIPGSAGSAVLAPAVTAARSAESIRGRLASYQQGVRQGRETRLRGLGSDQPAPPADTGADHDEESS